MNYNYAEYLLIVVYNVALLSVLPTNASTSLLLYGLHCANNDNLGV